MDFSENYFDGESNITRGQRKEGKKILSEILALTASSEGTSIRYVDINQDHGDDADGSLATPYSSIQDAIDDLESAIDAGLNYANYSIKISGGIYDENLVIHKENINLIANDTLGAFGSRSVIVRPTTGDALIFTNATPASLTTYLSSGTYSDLVNQGDKGPQFNVCYGISFDGSITSGNHACQLLGVQGDQSPSTTLFGRLYFVECSFTANSGTSETFFARNAGYVGISRCQFAASHDDLRSINSYNIVLDDNSFGFSMDIQHIASDPNGSHANAVSSAGSEINNSIFVFGTVSASGASECVVKKSTFGLHESGAPVNFDFDDTSELYLIGSDVKGNIDMEGTADFGAWNTHVQGNLTFASGGGSAEMYGGQYIGTLTDPDVKFVRTLGS
jgi:hypothetical protein